MLIVAPVSYKLLFSNWQHARNIYIGLCKMKKRELEKRLSQRGWWLDRHGSNHDVWTNGDVFESVPRHAEIGEGLSRKILKKAENNPPFGKGNG